MKEESDLCVSIFKKIKYDMKAPSLSANFAFFFFLEQLGIHVLIMWVPFNLDFLFIGPGVGTKCCL